MTAADGPIPFVLCFDVEPDDVEVALEPRPWLGFEQLVKRAALLRTELAANTGRAVHFNWFLRMDPQIAESHGQAGWVADRYGDRLEAIRNEGDTIGLHPHAWRWLPDSRRWLADHGNAAWIEHCLRVSFDAYEKALGETCRYVRWGDHFTSPAAIRVEAELGARYELTVEPGAPALRSMHRTPSTGRLVSMEFAPRAPYRPSIEDPVSPADARIAGDDAGLWMIPLTSLDPDPALSLWRRIGRRVRHRGRPLHRPASLVAGMWAADTFWRGVQEVIDASPIPYLAFAIRSDAPLRPASIGPFEAKFAALAHSPLMQRLSFTTPDVVVRTFESRPL